MDKNALFESVHIESHQKRIKLIPSALPSGLEAKPEADE
jgi:hypothetical protein